MRGIDGRSERGSKTIQHERRIANKDKQAGIAEIKNTEHTQRELGSRRACRSSGSIVGDPVRRSSPRPPPQNPHRHIPPRADPSPPPSVRHPAMRDRRVRAAQAAVLVRRRGSLRRAMGRRLRARRFARAAGRGLARTGLRRLTQFPDIAMIPTARLGRRA